MTWVLLFCFLLGQLSFYSELVDPGLKPLRGSGSCHSERSGEPEFEESRKLPTLDSSSRSLSRACRRAPQNDSLRVWLRPRYGQVTCM